MELNRDLATLAFLDVPLAQMQRLVSMNAVKTVWIASCSHSSVSVAKKVRSWILRISHAKISVRKVRATSSPKRLASFVPTTVRTAQVEVLVTLAREAMNWMSGEIATLSVKMGTIFSKASVNSVQMAAWTAITLANACHVILKTTFRSLGPST